MAGLDNSRLQRRPHSVHHVRVHVNLLRRRRPQLHLDRLHVNPPGLKDEGGQHHDHCNQERRDESRPEIVLALNRIAEHDDKDGGQRLSHSLAYCGIALHHQPGQPVLADEDRHQDVLPLCPPPKPRYGCDGHRCLLPAVVWHAILVIHHALQRGHGRRADPNDQPKCECPQVKLRSVNVVAMRSLSVAPRTSEADRLVFVDPLGHDGRDPAHPNRD
mmetsp:Transcript_31500/g.90722  ORF Transcript_31500/g.90722 Transcript_31500/m.90722 type:complete len:217 (+) Transcript_31500:1439-2089(+)